MLVAQYNINRTPQLPPHPVLAAPASGYDRFVNRLILEGAGGGREIRARARTSAPLASSAPA